MTEPSGAEFGRLEDRVAEIEIALKHLASRSSNPCGQSVEEAPAEKPASLDVNKQEASASLKSDSAQLGAYIEVVFPNSWEEGRCTWKGGRKVTFFDSGFAAIDCYVDCNEPLFFDCDFETTVYAVLEHSGGSRIEVMSFLDVQGGTSRNVDISRRTTAPVKQIIDNYSRIWGARIEYTCTCFHC